MNKLDLNVNKCRVVSFHRKKYPVHYEYKFNNVVIDRVYQFEDLGIILDDNLSFIQHTEKMINKANAMMGFMFRCCKDFKDLDTFKAIYSMLVRSQVDYLSVIWDPQYDIRIKRLERIQRKFTRRVCRCILKIQDNTTYTDRCKLIQLLPLNTRRTISSACFIFDLLNNKTYSSELLANLDFLAKNLNIRNRSLIQPRYHRTNYGTHNPLDMAIKNFNLYYSVYDFNISKNEFKNRINKFVNLL